jgi:hypothetical protein
MNGIGRPRVNYTNKDYTALRDDLLELAQEKLPEWTDHSPNDLGVMLLELFAYMGDMLLYYQDRIANESFLDSAIERRSVINLLRLIGCEVRPPKPASADLTLLFADDGTGIVTIDPGAEFQTSAEATGEAMKFQYLGDPLVIDLDPIPAIEPYEGEVFKRYAKTLPVVQVDAYVPDTSLGSSDASPSQRFCLARIPLIEDTLMVTVDEGAGPQVWQRVDTFLHSRFSDEHYRILRDERDRAWVEFGDGMYGRIPQRGRDNIAASYRVGGGVKGNVPALSITKAVTSIDHLEHVFNELAATGGSDAEDSTEASARGPNLFRAMGRAVTAQDYEDHARNFGVGKVRARAGGWNRIELYVAPVGGGYPSDTLKEDLRAYFDDKRVLTSILDIHDPVYINVFVEGTLEVEPYFFADQVQQQVENAVQELLTFDNVEFEDRLYLSKVYEAVEDVEGVAGVNITRFARSDSVEDLPSDGTLRFAWSEIPRAGFGEGVMLTEVRGGHRVA